MENKRILRFVCNLKSLISLSLLIITISVFSQSYPIQLVVANKDTSSLFLSELTSFVSGKLSVSIVSNDISIINYKVKLQLTIENIDNPTFQIKSTPSINVPFITIDKGIVVMVDSSDLLPYINPDNLDFNGYDKNEFIQSGSLPSGMYKFSFQVVDYVRNSVVSNRAYCYVRMIKSENAQGQIKNFELISNLGSDGVELLISLNETAPVDVYLYRTDAVTTSRKYRLTDLKEYSSWINVGDLAPGIYLVRIVSKGMSMTKKIVILASI